MQDAQNKLFVLEIFLLEIYYLLHRNLLVFFKIKFFQPELLILYVILNYTCWSLKYSNISRQWNK